MFSVVDPGEGPGGGRPPLFLDQTGQKEFFGRPPPPPLSKDLDDRAPPYLKVWIRHWFLIQPLSYFTLLPRTFKLTNPYNYNVVLGRTKDNPCPSSSKIYVKELRYYETSANIICQSLSPLLYQRST